MRSNGWKPKLEKLKVEIRCSFFLIGRAINHWSNLQEWKRLSITRGSEVKTGWLSEVHILSHISAQSQAPCRSAVIPRIRSCRRSKPITIIALSDLNSLNLHGPFSTTLLRHDY